MKAGRYLKAVHAVLNWLSGYVTNWQRLWKGGIPSLLQVWYCLLIWNFSFLLYGTFIFFHVWVRRLVLTTTGSGTMVFIDKNNLITRSGTKTICCQI